METNAESLATMKRAGLVLALIGVLDIASCVVAVVRGESYSSSLNVFALIAGILVYRGSQGAARFVVRGLAFLLGVLVAIAFAGPLIVPLPVLWFYLKSGSWGALISFGVFIGVMGVLFWVREQLRSLPIFSGGQTGPPLYRSVAAGIGVALAVGMVFLMTAVMTSFGARAIAEASRQVGPGHSFYVEQMNAENARGHATVLAYTDTEFRRIEVEWNDGKP